MKKTAKKIRNNHFYFLNLHRNVIRAGKILLHKKMYIQ